MRIAMANDHAAAAMRSELVAFLKKGNHEVLDCGTDTPDPVDYPDTAEKAMEAMLDGRADRAILVCGTGLGMSYVGNKFPGMRCALCTDEYSARMAREHNDANVLALRARRMDIDQNLRIIDTFLNTRFPGEARHKKRIAKIAAIENRLKERK